MHIRELLDKLFPNGTGGATRKPEWLIVGLGNPGAKYFGTRHNIGWDIIDEQARRRRVTLHNTTKLSDSALAEFTEIPFILSKPKTYVNLSGDAVKLQVNENNLKADRVIVICDDLNLDIGKLRVRKKGSEGGHNGLKSIVTALGTKEFCRIRVGIGKPASPEHQIEYVLGRPTANERKKISTSIKQGSDAIEDILRYGIDKAMNLHNG